jgi:GT2 family glycosyltransferase
VTVVIVSRDRAPRLAATLDELHRLSPGVPVILVDNGSRDGTVEMVRRAHPEVRVIALDGNRGGAGRTCGVLAARTSYVAFSDDDSWWAEGALERAAAVLDAHPRLGLLAGRVLVGPEAVEDPICAAMAASPLPRDRDAPGPEVLGFLACGAVVRREAYLSARGFHPRFGVGGEEALLALDLASQGWRLAYVDAVVAHHHPATARRDPVARRRREVRNRLWVHWLRRPLPAATRRTLGALATAPSLDAAAGGLVAALAGLPWVVRERRPVDRDLDRRLRLLDGGLDASDLLRLA